jgi:hypothetical protein
VSRCREGKRQEQTDAVLPLIAVAFIDAISRRLRAAIMQAA